jgi:hypothetical protein
VGGGGCQWGEVGVSGGRWVSVGGGGCQWGVGVSGVRVGGCGGRQIYLSQQLIP